MLLDDLFSAAADEKIKTFRRLQWPNVVVRVVVV